MGRRGRAEGSRGRGGVDGGRYVEVVLAESGCGRCERRRRRRRGTMRARRSRSCGITRRRWWVAAGTGRAGGR